ncbi:hypothetical protein QO034_19190 [Sedimentitalea sp. JM2-8]|uniref:Uncharacterized protein n=1 Tax=Sedimentitalea xiamensis TaxID=3050037 RepID=A0ABT7FJ97_9RHOB|nr:hypothetical protein [Sedimentitalea xiamensis]MDK3075217.1 hypothetical protein [Sedimentitalea xiamensis]
MFEAFLVATSTEGLQPLGTAAQRSFELITGTLRSRLGEDHARLFAEPVATEHGDKIDWYAPFAGQAIRFPDVAPEQQSVLRDRIGAMVAAIRMESDRLADSADPQDQRLSEALSNAVEIPDETMIFAIPDDGGVLRPVLVHWAWLRDRRDSVRGVLTAMVPRPESRVSPDVAAGPAAERTAVNWTWLLLPGWLLLAALLAAILYLLIAPCDVNPGRFGTCPGPDPQISAVPGEIKVIEDEIAALKREIALLDRNCQPVIPISPAAETPQQGGGLPILPEPPPTPEPAPDDKTERSPEDVSRQIVERGSRRGALNFALSWGTTDDIDLSVTCPTGQVISYLNRSDCGGGFDLDANVVRARAISDPVENIVFDDPVPGVYTVRVNLKSNRTTGEKPVTLHVLRQDGRDLTYSGKVDDKSPEWTLNISISR